MQNYNAAPQKKIMKRIQKIIFYFHEIIQAFYTG